MKRVFAALVVLVGSLSAFAALPVGALSSDPKQFVSADNTFYAYVKGGETISAAFNRVAQEEPFGTIQADVTITVDGPDAGQQKCVAPKNVAVGQGCRFAPQTAQKSGIWRIQFSLPEGAKAYHELSPAVRWGKNLFDWDITVAAGGAEQHGRVWTERYAIRQPAAASFIGDFVAHYISEDGYIYRATYRGYNGQISTLSADAIGIRGGTGCVSAYQSTDVANAKYSPALGSCGSGYKLFFEEPAGDLPGEATTWDDKKEWVRPNIVRPSIGELHFTSDKSTDQQSGNISFFLRNFIGQYQIKIDVEGDGDFNGQSDVVLHQQMKRLSSSLQRVRFDGVDKTGQIIPPSQKIGIKVEITKVAEIHLVAADLEGRTGGLELIRLNGDNAPTTGLCWNDTELSPLAADLMPKVVDGRGCPDSTGGVHGWAYADNSWGNARFIDDWVYASAKLEGKNQIAYPEDGEAAALTGGRAMPPVEVIIAAISFLLIAGTAVIVVLRKKRRPAMPPPSVPPAQFPPPMPPYQNQSGTATGPPRDDPPTDRTTDNN